MKSFSLGTLLVVISLLSAAVAVYSARNKLRSYESQRTIYAELPTSQCGMEYITKDSVLLRIGTDAYAKISIERKSSDGDQERVHLQKLGTGLHVVSFFHNQDGSFGYCVDGVAKSVDGIGGEASMSSINIVRAPEWEMVWTSFGQKESASVDLQWGVSGVSDQR